MHGIIESISVYIQGLEPFWQAVMTFIISMLPVIELRGAIPIAAHAGLAWYVAFPIAVVGNMLPVPFILFFIRRIFEFMRKHIPFLNKVVDKMEKKVEKNKDKIIKYELLGLFILVAIPLPGTGAWTGALVAALMNLRIKNAFPAILLGVIAAGIVMTILSYAVKAVAGS